MTKKWNEYGVAPQCDGFYEVRVPGVRESANEADPMRAEWCDGEWWLEISTGRCNGDLIPNITLGEMAEEPSVIAMLARVKAARAIC